MNHKGIDHIQMPKHFKKAEGLAWLTAMAGLVTGNFTTAGAGILAGSKNTSTSRFDHVKKIIRKKGFTASRSMKSWKRIRFMLLMKITSSSGISLPSNAPVPKSSTEMSGAVALRLVRQPPSTNVTRKCQ